jgi:riboflavin transporter FmnP
LSLRYQTGKELSENILIRAFAQGGEIIMQKKNRIHNLTVAAMLSAVAFIFMFIEFPLPMLIPSFVKKDFSDLPALLGAFALGPVYGIVISFMKNLLHIVVKGTSTACVGELCNFMLGAVFSFVAGFIYKRNKTRKTAIIGAIVGAAAMAIFSVPSNYWITYPAYVKFYHMPLEAILAMYQAILPSANSLIKCLVIFNMPFTLAKGLLDALLCILIYKPLSPILHGKK